MFCMWEAYEYCRQLKFVIELNALKEKNKLLNESTFYIFSQSLSQQNFKSHLRLYTIENRKVFWTDNNTDKKIFYFSSPEHKVLKVSYYDRILSVVRPPCIINNCVLQAVFCIRYSWKFIRTFISIKSWTNSKLGHIRSPN